MAEIETQVSPPEPDQSEEGFEPSARLSVSFLSVGDVHHDASLQLFGADCEDPDKLANALLGAALALAHLRGPDFAWAVMRRFAAYDGGGAS